MEKTSYNKPEQFTRINCNKLRNEKPAKISKLRFGEAKLLNDDQLTFVTYDKKFTIRVFMHNAICNSYVRII